MAALASSSRPVFFKYVPFFYTMLSGTLESQLYLEFSHSSISKSLKRRKDWNTRLLVVRLVFIIVSVDTIPLHASTPWYARSLTHVTWTSRKAREGQRFFQMLSRKAFITLRGNGT